MTNKQWVVLKFAVYTTCFAKIFTHWNSNDKIYSNKLKVEIVINVPNTIWPPLPEFYSAPWIVEVYLPLYK